MKSCRIESGPSGLFSVVFSSSSCLDLGSGQDLLRMGFVGEKINNKLSLFRYQFGMLAWLGFTGNTGLLISYKKDLAGHNGLWSKIGCEKGLRNFGLLLDSVGKFGQGDFWLYNIDYCPRSLKGVGNGFWYYWILVLQGFKECHQVWRGVLIKLWIHVLSIYITGFRVQTVSLAHVLSFSHLRNVEDGMRFIMERILLDLKVWLTSLVFLVLYKDSNK